MTILKDFPVILQEINPSGTRRNVADKKTFSDWKANVSDVARPNKFIVEINPDFLPKSPSILRFLATSASIPDIDVSGPAFRFKGQEYQFLGTTKHGTIDINFLNDVNFQARTFFETWLDDNHNQRTNKRANIGDKLLGEVKVYQLDGQNQAIAGYGFQGALPLRMSGISLAHASKDSLEEFGVSFSYHTWGRFY